MCLLGNLRPEQRCTLNRCSPCRRACVQNAGTENGGYGRCPALQAMPVVNIPDTDHLSVIPDQRFKDEVLAFLEGQ